MGKTTKRRKCILYSIIVYNPLRSPLFIQADLVGNHSDEFTIRGFAAEVVTTLYRHLKALNLCNHSDTIACVLYELLVNLELINVGFQTHD